MESNALRKGLLSFIIPGLGQAINGDKQKGIVMFIILILLNIIIYFFINNRFGQSFRTSHKHNLFPVCGT